MWTAPLVKEPWEHLRVEVSRQACSSHYNLENRGTAMLSRGEGGKERLTRKRKRREKNRMGGK